MKTKRNPKEKIYYPRFFDYGGGLEYKYWNGKGKTWGCIYNKDLEKLEKEKGITRQDFLNDRVGIKTWRIPCSGNSFFNPWEGFSVREFFIKEKSIESKEA